MPEGSVQSPEGRSLVRGRGRAPQRLRWGPRGGQLDLSGCCSPDWLPGRRTAQESQRWLDRLAGPQLLPQGKHHGSHKDKSLLAQPLERRVGVLSWKSDSRRVRAASRAGAEMEF